MRGYPLTRAASPDGRWAYTLYDGGGKHPFVHALDMLEGQAVCIDLPHFAHQGANNGQLRTSSDGGLLTLVRRREPVAVIDTETFGVTKPSDPRPASPEVDAVDSGVPWATDRFGGGRRACGRRSALRTSPTSHPATGGRRSPVGAGPRTGKRREEASSSPP